MRSQGKLRPMHRSLKSPIVRHVAIVVAGLCALIAARPAPAQALHDVAALKVQVEAFANGAPARIDPRLVVARCPAPAFSWARADVVRADCAGPVWTLYVPVDQLFAGQPVPRVRPAIRRGDRVMVETGGPGWSVAMEAEAERDADGDRVPLKGPAGRRFTGRIADGGKVVLAR